jgi:hypothetical protein
LSSRTARKSLRLERGSLEPENIYGQEKLCTKNPTHDCRCGQIKARTKDCAKGSNRCGDYCRHCRRRRSGHEVSGRPERPDAENRGQKAVWKKPNEDERDRAKEKTLDRRGCQGQVDDPITWLFLLDRAARFESKWNCVRVLRRYASDQDFYAGLSC